MPFSLATFLRRPFTLRMRSCLLRTFDNDPRPIPTNLGQVFWASIPPSTGMTAPLRYDAAGSTSDSVMLATSDGSP